MRDLISVITQRNGDVLRLVTVADGADVRLRFEITHKGDLLAAAEVDAESFDDLSDAMATTRRAHVARFEHRRRKQERSHRRDEIRRRREGRQ